MEFERLSHDAKMAIYSKAARGLFDAISKRAHQEVRQRFNDICQNPKIELRVARAVNSEGETALIRLLRL